MNHIPEGYHAVTPYLLLADPQAFIEFAVAGLGATAQATHHDESGRLMHGELLLHGCILEIGQPREEAAASRMHFHVFVPDPDAAQIRAIEHGATLLYEMADHDYGERSGGVQDRWGNQWYFAKVIDHEARSS